ncbi:MAG: hypothetical protein Q4F88_05410 [Eubacteriales bacterium]|nr:hypothetical protein [Eubacteriales bacterium]
MKKINMTIKYNKSIIIFFISIFLIIFYISKNYASETIFMPGIEILKGDSVGDIGENGSSTAISKEEYYRTPDKNINSNNEVYYIRYHINNSIYDKDNTASNDILLSNEFVYEYDGKKAFVLPHPKGMGKIFYGWYDNELCNGKPLKEIKAFSYKNYDLYAYFIEPLY